MTVELVTTCKNTMGKKIKPGKSLSLSLLCSLPLLADAIAVLGVVMQSGVQSAVLHHADSRREYFNCQQHHQMNFAH